MKIPWEWSTVFCSTVCSVFRHLNIEIHIMNLYCTVQRRVFRRLQQTSLMLTLLFSNLPCITLEMRCYRKILCISYKDRVTNEEVRAKIQQAVGPHEDLLTIVKRYKLQWYGHVSRSSGLAKTILQGTVRGGRRQGTVKGGRRQGRQRKRWRRQHQGMDRPGVH